MDVRGEQDASTPTASAASSAMPDTLARAITTFLVLAKSNSLTRFYRHGASWAVALETINGTLQLTRLMNESADYVARREELRLAEIESMRQRERRASRRRDDDVFGPPCDVVHSRNAVERRVRTDTKK
jgi:hypothetical protein